MNNYYTMYVYIVFVVNLTVQTEGVLQGYISANLLDENNKDIQDLLTGRMAANQVHPHSQRVSYRELLFDALAALFNENSNKYKICGGTTWRL